jgi:hypothetical protein
VIVALVMALVAGIPLCALAQEPEPVVDTSVVEPEADAEAAVEPAVEVPPPELELPEAATPPANAGPVEAAPALPEVAPLPAAAPVPPEVVPLVEVVPFAPERWAPIFTASQFTRYELRHGYDDLGIARGRFLEGDAIFYRVRLGFNTGLLALTEGLKASLQLTPQAAGTFGENGPSTIADARLGLHEGYARLQGRRVRFDAGRYELLYGDALMIGNNDWNAIGRTFDGVRARIGGQAWLDLFANVIDEGRTNTQGDLYFLGAYGALGSLVHAYLAEVTDLDVYLLSRVWGVARDGDMRREGAREFTVGTRSKGRIGRYDFRVETGVQAGTRPGLTRSTRAVAWQGDVEVGRALLDERLRIALEALFATGAKPDSRRSHGWEDLFPSGHKWLGLTDAFSQNGQKRTNVCSLVLHVSARALERLTVQFDAHLFARPQPTTVAGEYGFAGGEFDTGVAYTIVKGVRVRALYALFLPSGDLYNDVVPDRMRWRDPDPAQYFEAELRYDL